MAESLLIENYIKPISGPLSLNQNIWICHLSATYLPQDMNKCFIESVAMWYTYIGFNTWFFFSGL